MKMKKLMIVVSCFAAGGWCLAAGIDLSGTWTLCDGKGGHRVEAQVPGDNYTALEAAKVIPDPYWRCNETNVQWVAEEDWTYSRSFDAPADVLSAKAAVLSFDSIDTVAEVVLNGRTVARTANEFRRVALKPGESKDVAFAVGDNELKIYTADRKWVVEPGPVTAFVGFDAATTNAVSSAVAR